MIFVSNFEVGSLDFSVDLNVAKGADLESLRAALFASQRVFASLNSGDKFKTWRPYFIRCVMPGSMMNDPAVEDHHL